MLDKIRFALLDESGAVSIDWLVITSAVVAIGVATGIAVRPAISTTAQAIGPAAADVSVGTSF